MAATVPYLTHRGRGEWNDMDTKFRLCAVVALAFALVACKHENQSMVQTPDDPRGI